MADNNAQMQYEAQSFEENLKLLSAMVSDLERGNLALEAAVNTYGEGLKIAAVCRKQLDEAKLKITGDVPDKKEEQS